MVESNSDDPPTSSAPENEPGQGTIPQSLVRIVVGILGAFFAVPAVWVLIVVFTQQHTLAELSVYPAMLVGGLAVGWASFSRLILLRILAWSTAGLGAGLILEAILSGGLGVGTFITLSGIVLAIVGAVLGFRSRPRIAK
jgi:hypothetical protein